MEANLPLKAAVIGGGMMGALLQQPKDMPPITHAGGFLHHPDFELVGICDTQPSTELRAWPCKIFTEVGQLLNETEPSVVSVAIPKEAQPRVLEDLLESNVLAVIAEKPLAVTLQEACSIRDKYQAAGKTLFVNLPRRFSPLYRELASKFHSDQENVLCATLHYGKGLLHNGIHAVDLARMLFGEVTRYEPLAAWHDVFIEDPSMTVFLECEHCRQFHLNALDDGAFTAFELDIITNKNRYIINNDHRTLSLSTVKDNAGIPSGNRMISIGSQDTDYEQLITKLLDNVRDVVRGAATPHCTAETICTSHLVINNILEKAREYKIV